MCIQPSFRPHHLSTNQYCKNENVAGVEDFCLAAIDLNLVDVSDTNDTVHSGRSFEILFPDTSDKMVLRASTAEDATEWVRILKELKATPAPAADGSGAAPPPAPVEGSPSNATEDEATDEAKYMVKQARSSILVVDENLVSPLGVGDRPIAMRAQSRKAAAIEQQEVPEEVKNKTAMPSLPPSFSFLDASVTLIVVPAALPT